MLPCSLSNITSSGEVGVSAQATKNGSECRRAQDAKRDIPVPLSPCARRQPCGPGRPAPGHGAVTTSPLRGRSDCAMTLRRMARRRVGCALHTASTAPGPAAPAPLRRHARADAFRGLPAFASLSMAGSGSRHRRARDRPGPSQRGCNNVRATGAASRYLWKNSLGLGRLGRLYDCNAQPSGTGAHSVCH